MLNIIPKGINTYCPKLKKPLEKSLKKEKKYEAETNQRAQVVESRQRQYQRLQSELDGYFKMRAKEEMTGEEFASKKSAIIEEQAILKEKIDDGLSGQRTWLELAEDFMTTAFQAREMILSDDLVAKRKAVEKVGWNVMIKDKKIVWSFNQPYDVLLKPEYRTDMRAAWDDFRATNWIDSIDYPTISLQQTQQLLALPC